MGVYFFHDSKDLFGSFTMDIDAGDEDIDELLSEFKRLVNTEDDVHYSTGAFQDFLDSKGIDSEFIYDVCELHWR